MSFFIGNYNVKYVGAINLRELIKLIHDWFLDNEWVTENPEDFPEIYYSHSRSQPEGQEIWIWWRFSWAPEKNPYYRYLMRVSIHSFKMNEQEMLIKNRKEKMHKGDHQVIITSILETDYKKEWEKHPILKNFNELFRMRIMAKDFENRKEDLHHQSQHLQSEIKGFFDSPHYEHHGKPFVPKQGIKEEGVGPA